MCAQSCFDMTSSTTLETTPKGNLFFNDWCFERERRGGVGWSVAYAQRSLLGCS